MAGKSGNATGGRNGGKAGGKTSPQPIGGKDKGGGWPSRVPFKDSGDNRWNAEPGKSS